MKKKRSKSLLIGGIIGALYLVYLLYSMGSTAGGAESDAELAGVGIAYLLMMPHLVLTLLAVIFNWIAYIQNHRTFALTTGILYSVAALVFPLYALFVVPSLILGFVGFANLKGIIAQNEEMTLKS